MARNRKTQARRYYYQNCLKDPIKVNGVTKHIELPYLDFKSIPKPYRFYVGQLIKHWGYNVQYKLFEAPTETPPPAMPRPERKKHVFKKNAERQLTLL